ncbi:MAG: LysM peptidoglycan-binding domain-containing protein [SAR92 clade bacterium]|uniref:LysM peptidoglycan-binding domain-containing protein n=1 Tax=SAR92 clade bacterium TaxID=2315479 RepID=A0A520MHI5_9GAMM|nr:MAG: LysM peptidoglycan-binding domain-containing protein [SAR92 clade bacterium]
MRKEIFVWLFSLLVVSCSNNPASVTDRSQPPSIRIKSHQVDVGETLYSIAWRYDLNVVDLANANSLYEPYIINPGQELTLLVSLKKYSGTPNPKKRYKVRAGDTLFSIATKHGLDVKTLANINNLDSPYIITPNQILALDEKNVTITQTREQLTSTARDQRTNPVTRPKSVVYAKNWQWKWPVKAEVLEPFNPKNLQKGISLKASSNAKVNPAAPGNVVYAGEGLRGYGKLIIIKHSDMLLSAYANNEELLVRVGQSVDQTDVISSLGVDGTMYFEIRKDGNPVNPINYLR